MRQPFTERVVKLIKSIPKGKVASYGQIARMAGSPTAARQVVRLLHSLSDSDRMPWHRVVNGHGGISLAGFGGEFQRSLLEREGVEFGLDGRIDLFRFRWKPKSLPR